ncbi:serine/threonine protein kinase [Streptomyces sp. YS-3]|uniref:serine/threonine protein kinase n=1 Tax=Streptomyces sp. YS-3 TaxID=3381352 RepID=UPI0038627199
MRASPASRRSVPAGDPLSVRVRPAQPGDPVRIGPYRIVGRLGSGGMGTVHAALDPTGLRVAVKLIHPAQAADPEFRARFRREVELSRRVTGPSLVPLLSADPEAALPWLATSYVPGPTLNEHVAAHGPLTGGSLYAFATGTATALAAIHAANVIHRDLKPQNVILAPAGPMILDFGIARALDGTSVTRTGSMTGTPGWISPEHYRNGTTAAAGDIFTWGALIAYAATGRLPFGSGAPDVVAFRIMSEPADLEGIPEGLRRVLEKALAKGADERGTADAAAEKCAKLLAAQTTQVVDAGLEPTRVGNLVATGWQMPPIPDPSWHLPPAHTGKRTVATVLVAAAVVGALTGGGLVFLPKETTGDAPAAAPGTNIVPTPAHTSPQPSATPARAGGSGALVIGGSPSLATWHQARPAQGQGEHDVARAVLHDTGTIWHEGIEVAPKTVTFHEPRKEVYLSYSLTGVEAVRLYTETEIASSICLTLRDVVRRLHPDLPYRKYVLVNESPGSTTRVAWDDDFMANSRCRSAADQETTSVPDTWQPNDDGQAAAMVPSTDLTEIRVADQAARKIIARSNSMQQTLGTVRTLSGRDISVGFDPAGSATYVWSNYNMWSRDEVDVWAAMAAGEACRALVRQRKDSGTAWPYVHYAVAEIAASRYQVVRSGTATTASECPA